MIIINDSNKLLILYAFNNPEFKKYYKRIYPRELELKETTENNFGSSYLDIYYLG